MEVPLIRPDLPTLADVSGPLCEALDSGRVTNFGKYMCALEAEVDSFLGVSSLAVSSGTTGLILALRALGLRRGGKVVIPSFTFPATALAVVHAGGVPLFAEISDDMTLSTTDLAELLMKHDDIDVVLPVHLYGQPCGIDEIEQLVREAEGRSSRKISILYDSAHGFGAAYKGCRVGHFGDAEVFSLSATKVFNSVEGGLVSSRDSEFLSRVKKLRNYGMELGFDTGSMGLNGKMSELHAIVGLHNLRQFPGTQTARLQQARCYLEKIAQVSHFTVPRLRPEVEHAYKDMVVLVDDSLAGKRDAVAAFLKERGIETRSYFHPPVHQQTAFRRYADRALPYTQDVSERVVCLPFSSRITSSEIEYVVDALAEAERCLA